MKKVLFLALALAVPASFSADFRMPPSFRTLVSDGSGRTWKETGSLPQPFATALATVRASFDAQGWTVDREFAPEGEPDASRMFQCSSGASELLLLALRDSPTNTLVSWGFLSRGEAAGAEPAPVPSAEATSSSTPHGKPELRAEFAELPSKVESRSDETLQPQPRGSRPAADAAARPAVP